MVNPAECEVVVAVHSDHGNWGVTVLLAVIAVSPAAYAERPRVGAIRWDAWQESGKVRIAVEKALSPVQWHHRLPFFGKVTGPNSVAIDGNSQTVMDQEIAYAAKAGLDYWAFVAYPDDAGMSNGLQPSCLVISPTLWIGPDPTLPPHQRRPS